MVAQIISSMKELQKVSDTSERLMLFGAGNLTKSLLEILKEQEIPISISYILVTNPAENPVNLQGIPVKALTDMVWREHDSVVLSVSGFYYEEICKKLEAVNANTHIYGLDYDIVDEIPYQKVYSCFEDFIRGYQFPERQAVVEQGGKYAWTCWWQGEKEAPELVQACIASQKKNLPGDVEHIVITKDNYQNYIKIPEYILKKVQDGSMMLAHLSDYIRCSLLYHWGGIWLDAAVYLVKPFPVECREYSLYTRRVKGRSFCAKGQWTIGFLCAVRGNRLFHFLMKAYEWYFKGFDRILYYLMTDYLIAIASNTFPEIEEQLLQIPYNNDKAFELGKHLKEPYEERQYEKYIGSSFVQILNRRVTCSEQDTIYAYLLREADR